MQQELENPKIDEFMSKLNEWNVQTDLLEKFDANKKQVLAGSFEAKINYEYLKDLELPFITLTSNNGLTNAPLLFPAMMSNLQNLFAKSSFYKESRLISFLEKLINEILKAVEHHINIKEMFNTLLESKGKAKKSGIRLAQAHMIIDIMIKNMFITDWLESPNSKPTTADSKESSKSDSISYLKFSRPDTAYIHDSSTISRPQSGKYVEITNKKLPPHLRIQERLAVTSEKHMWFERAKILLDTLDYAKKAAANIDAMCSNYAKIVELLSATDPKIKQYADGFEFLNMYKDHEIEYEIFEIQSAEMFDSFVVFLWFRSGYM